MPRGGARNRSGPPADPDSARTERRGLVLTALPPGGYSGKVPRFPLPDPLPRETSVWRNIWKAPQGAAWIEMPWLWREIALWVRLSVKSEDHECMAAVLGSVHRYTDRIGLSEAGMREKGWKIGPAPTAAAPEETAPTGKGTKSRLAVVQSA